MKYVGLTDDPARRKLEHGNPADWWEGSFSTEANALTWEQALLVKPGYSGSTGGHGWRYGYTYTISPSTRE